MSTSEEQDTAFVLETSAGDVLFREGERGHLMYVLREGRVRLTKRVDDTERLVAELGPGEFLGEMAVLSGRPRTATATCVGAGQCLAVDGTRFAEMVKNSGEIALRLVIKLAKRLESADALIEILLHKDPKARVMLGLWRRAEAVGVRTEDGIRVTLGYDDFAREVDVEPVVVVAVVAQLEGLRLLRREGTGGLLLAEVDHIENFIEFLEPVFPSRAGSEGSLR